MLEKDYNPIVTKKELIDILYENFQNTVSKIDLEKFMNDNYKSGEKSTKICSITKEQVLLHSIINKNFHFNAETFDKVISSKDFKVIDYFQIEDNKYIYFYLKPNIELDLFYLIPLEQIDYILDNKLNNGINNDELKNRRANYTKKFNNLKKNEPLNVKFKEYDYIQIICENGNYNDIGIKDIKKCADFLKYNEFNKFLTIEEQILLRLIILLGIKNIYLNYTEYYQEQCKEKIIDLNQIIEKINDYILFIQENMNKIEEKTLYSFNYLYCLDLKDYCSNIFVYLKKDYSIWDESISLYEKVDIEFISFLRYISFDYYVSNKKFEEASKIFQMELPLFKYLKDSAYNSKDMIIELIGKVLERNYKDNENEMRKQRKILYDTLSSDDKTLLYNYFSQLNIMPTIRKNIKVLLKFYIDCYYYFMHFKSQENANKLYEFLLYFRRGYGIDDFILKCRYLKMVDDLNGYKIENIDNIEEVNNAINKLGEKIDDMKLVNKFDIDDIESIYNNIKFNNFKKENREFIKRCIATGDKIMNTFNIIDMDFSNVVVEWSKAVETALYEKLFSEEIISLQEKDKLENDFKKINSKQHFKLKDSKKITVGIFNDMENYTNGKQNLFEYLYNQYFSKYYTLNKETYKNLCKYLKIISKPRNESAHKGKIIDKNIALGCKEEILASKKILEILSKLEKNEKQ